MEIIDKFYLVKEMSSEAEYELDNHGAMVINIVSVGHSVRLSIESYEVAKSRIDLVVGKQRGDKFLPFCSPRKNNGDEYYYIPDIMEANDKGESIIEISVSEAEELIMDFNIKKDDHVVLESYNRTAPEISVDFHKEVMIDRSIHSTDHKELLNMIGRGFIKKIYPDFRNRYAKPSIWFIPSTDEAANFLHLGIYQPGKKNGLCIGLENSNTYLQSDKVSVVGSWKRKLLKEG